MGSERQTGWYRWLRDPRIYDASQALVRGRAARETFVADFMRPRAGDRVLDIGCGTATVIRHLPAVEYTGIDNNPKYIQIAQRRFGRRIAGRRREGSGAIDGAASRPRFVCADLGTSLDNADTPFDIVIALGVLHHLSDPLVTGLCRRVVQLLASGGRFVTHDPVLTQDQSAMARWFVEHDRGKHVRTEDALLTLMRSAGLNPRSTITHSSLRIPYSEVLVEATVA